MDRGPNEQLRKNLQKALRDTVRAPLAPTMLAMLVQLNEGKRGSEAAGSPKKFHWNFVRSRHSRLLRRRPVRLRAK